MPLFYLHICNGSGFTQDEAGHDFPTLDAALDASIRGMRDLMAEELRGGEINLASFIQIEDEHRQTVATVSFSDAVSVKTEPCLRQGRLHGGA